MAWKKGQSGNPAGRPKGARDKLSEAMFKEACEHWKKHGVGALDQVRNENPARYLQFMSTILPKSQDVLIDEHSNWVINAQPALSDEEWADKHGVTVSEPPEHEEIPFNNGGLKGNV